jgi:hypothetical protein
VKKKKKDSVLSFTTPNAKQKTKKKKPLKKPRHCWEKMVLYMGCKNTN